MANLNETHPALVNEWHPSKNGQLLPSDVSYGSVRKVWWLGDCSHEWEAIIQSRTNGYGCPFCSGQKILSGFNDLATQFKNIAEEWHPSLNAGLSADAISGGSQKKVWWLGKCGHEWQATVANRTHSHSGCPVCAGKKILAGFNDLATTHPTISAQWNSAKNIGISADKMSAGSHKKVWWIDEYGHEWETSPKSRTMKLGGTGCPFCSGNKVLAGFNDLATTNPELVLEWNYLKNGISPSEISKGSGNKSIWWICSERHEWNATVGSRVRGRGCPYCANKKILPGYNDISTTHPHLVPEWDHDKNLSSNLISITYGNDKPVWWICAKGHGWKVAPYNRSYYQTGCPECVASTFVSKPENEIYQWLIGLGLEVRQSARQVIGKYELDLYLPKYKLGIEYNGLYWHSESAGRDKTYHYKKWVAAQNAGIQLVQIWEDEYLKNPEQIKNTILHKIGITAQSRIFARNTTATPIPKKNAESFLNENHIQGYASGSYYVGLTSRSNEELVAVIVLKKEPQGALNIIRYATSRSVVGGFTKLLSFAERSYSPASFVTFSDNCISDGGLYENNGFVVDKNLEPDYRYVVNGERKHKFGYRLKRFRDDPTLKWEEGLTERELASLNGIPRIWDAGKVRWVKYCTKTISK